ncbi:diguanylate cyclase domain-containing protein [Candidatus Nitrospira allomarina]|uniref:Diguanylate cyclase n=1 Tax=Candidatus Nitrospira allomarina TaxID=3020900 RepID=A0AA96GJX9_9BACT|nr:diguanylate cyclase [Candidatus Nitrospira allomarina]WNM59764.1 diguanylate cyclase [Candidatus Nitrospira allomarina]
MATFERLHHLLEQSLRDFQAESSDLSDTQEQELTQALHRLKGRLTQILSTTSEPPPLANLLSVRDQTVSLPARITLPEPSQIHFVTSCDGTILMANEVGSHILGMDLAEIGQVSIADYVAHEEWKILRGHLCAIDATPKILNRVLTILPTGRPSQKILCVVVPMLDQSQKVVAWHWGLTPEAESSSVQPFIQLVKSLESQLIAGQSVDMCLTQICDGLVRIFGFAFVWLTTMGKGCAPQLRAHAMTGEFDWETQGTLWWSQVSQQGELIQACEGSEISLLSPCCPSTSPMAWSPPGFRCHQTWGVPLALDEDCFGMLVVCSEGPQPVDPTVLGWLQVLGCEIERLMARGRQLDLWRLQSVAMGSVFDPVCVTDAQGRLEWGNDAYAALRGSSIQSLLGSPLNSFPHEELQDRMSLSDPSAQEFSYLKTEVMQTGSNGQSLVFEQVVTPLLNDQGDPIHFVVMLHDVTARKTQELLMKHHAYYDPLTDLPNRIMFKDRLEQSLAQARRNGTLLALFFLDLDNFKTINDYHGHQTGDRVLRIVAERLATCVRSTDTVARLCGDEFTVILQGLEHIQDIRQVALKILECLIPPIRLGKEKIPIQISIGISVYPKDSTDPHRLVEIADQAMYRAKERGGQCWYFATPEWNDE